MQLIRQNVGLTVAYTHDEDKPFSIVKSVDITNECPDYRHLLGHPSIRLMLNFGQTRKGVELQMVEYVHTDDWKAQVFSSDNVSRSVFYNLRDMDHLNSGGLYVDLLEHFRAYARRAGLNASSLAEMVKCVAPEINRERMIESIRRTAEQPDMPMEQVIEHLEKLGVSTEGLLAEV